MDASIHGLGAVLHQEQRGQQRVIAYAGRALKPSKVNYPAHKLEFLALKWAISAKYQDRPIQGGHLPEPVDSLCVRQQSEKTTRGHLVWLR